MTPTLPPSASDNGYLPEGARNTKLDKVGLTEAYRNELTELTLYLNRVDNNDVRRFNDGLELEIDR